MECYSLEIQVRLIWVLLASQMQTGVEINKIERAFHANCSSSTMLYYHVLKRKQPLVALSTYEFEYLGDSLVAFKQYG